MSHGDHGQHPHSHEHGEHPHSHEHGEHPHSHDPRPVAGAGRVTLLAGDPEAHREPLARGAGAGKILFLDAFSGIAGDMTVSALVDLGVPFAVVGDAVAALGVEGYRLLLSRASTGSIGATHFNVEVATPQPERRYRDVRQLLDASRLDAAVRTRALGIFALLAEAEAGVHRVPVDEVTFHEVGALDSLVDIVGAAACLEHLGARVVASPIPLGRGSVATAHGELPLPAPATLACLRGVPTVTSELEVELVTPTGAAIVAAVAGSFSRWPAMTPERFGWGAGTRMLPGRPNALRVVLGEPLPAAVESADLVLLEANVDDMTGELVAHALAQLLGLGALDAFATPVTMKKGRPGLVISALARAPQAEAIAGAMLRETTSLGVRRLPVTRLERPRRMVEVETRFGRIPLKVSEGPYGPPLAKPEFEACARAAAAAGVSVREVQEAALASFARLPA